ncbi:hypothetical protein F5Y10DRAFT_255337 [Nemania abortiva]|nr:hypothetical protein F5Y10DRAFT_255337 [Nemania abortiva]
MADKCYACPYYLKDSKNHSGCRKYQLKRIRDVKQHLSRRHRRPPYCPCCCNTFESEVERDEHVRAKQCDARVPPVEIDGFSADQQIALSKRTNSGQTAEDQWFIIWDILFLNTARPISVYLDKAISDEMFLLQQYMLNGGVAVAWNCLKEHSALSWRSPSNQADMASFQRTVVREVLEKVIVGMNDFMGGPTEANSSSLDASNPEAALRIDDRNNADLPRGQDQTDREPDTASRSSLLGSHSDFWELQEPEPESEFDDIVNWD